MSACDGACRERRVEGFCTSTTINMALFAKVQMSLHKWMKILVLFHIATAFKMEGEDCALICKDKYSLCEMGL